MSFAHNSLFKFQIKILLFFNFVHPDDGAHNLLQVSNYFLISAVSSAENLDMEDPVLILLLLQQS
jgi:hypothetical protein